MWMLYGANGFTGRLTAKLALERGLDPVLAGRNEREITALAERLGFEHRVFGLDDPAAVRAALEGVEAVLHMAGPFSHTARPMLDACLAAGAHYLDITGEIEVFEQSFARDAEAREAGVTVISGVGFDVVPTDCLAAMLAAELPGATHLELAIASGGGPTAGTTKSALESLGTGSRVREGGELVRIGLGERTREVPFPGRARTALAIPWGDLSTAWRTTQIPNITTWMAMPPRAIANVRRLDRLGPLLQAGPVQALLKKGVEWFVSGPDDDVLASARSEVWGEVRGPSGTVRGALSTPNGYTHTADASLRALQRVLEGVEPGATTPALAFGAGFVAACDDVEVVPPERASAG